MKRRHSSKRRRKKGSERTPTASPYSMHSSKSAHSPFATNSTHSPSRSPSLSPYHRPQRERRERHSRQSSGSRHSASPSSSHHRRDDSKVQPQREEEILKPQQTVQSYTRQIVNHPQPQPQQVRQSPHAQPQQRPHLPVYHNHNALVYQMQRPQSLQSVQGHVVPHSPMHYHSQSMTDIQNVLVSPPPTHPQHTQFVQAMAPQRHPTYQFNYRQANHPSMHKSSVSQGAMDLAFMAQTQQAQGQPQPQPPQQHQFYQ